MFRCPHIFSCCKIILEFSFNIFYLLNIFLSIIKDAVENFKKALELEPDNDSYKSNLQIAEDKVIVNLVATDFCQFKNTASVQFYGFKQGVTDRCPQTWLINSGGPRI